VANGTSLRCHLCYGYQWVGILQSPPPQGLTLCAARTTGSNPTSGSMPGYLEEKQNE